MHSICACVRMVQEAGVPCAYNVRSYLSSRRPMCIQHALASQSEVHAAGIPCDDRSILEMIKL
eukprot:1159157-Pelagomonas_calceolata.AAC.7